MKSSQIFSFESIGFECGIAHNGKEPINFKRFGERSGEYAFSFLDYVIVPVGADIGIHTHTKDNQEIYIIISGKGQMTLEDRDYKVKKGDVIVNSIGGTHGLKNIGKTEIKMIVIEIPVPGNPGM